MVYEHINQPSRCRAWNLTFSRHRAPPRNSLAGFSLIIIHNLFLQETIWAWTDPCMKHLISRPYYRKGSWGGAGPRTRGGEGRLSVLSFQTDPPPPAPCFSIFNQSSAAQSSKCLLFFLSQTTNLNFRSELRVNKLEWWLGLSLRSTSTFPTPRAGTHHIWSAATSHYTPL